MLREYLHLEFGDLVWPFEYDLESVIDDFVLICFFCGNDFLPHLPCLDIYEVNPLTYTRGKAPNLYPR